MKGINFDTLHRELPILNGNTKVNKLWHLVIFGGQGQTKFINKNNCAALSISVWFLWQIKYFIVKYFKNFKEVNFVVCLRISGFTFKIITISK